MSSGMTIFTSLDKIQKFLPTQAKLFSGGKIVLTYKLKNDEQNYLR
jgi:hypothetical protein